MKLDLNVCDTLLVGAKRLSGILGYELGSGIKVRAVKSDRLGVSLKDGEATIFYKEKNHFFRELGVLVENARKSDSFDITEDTFFMCFSHLCFILLNLSLISSSGNN